MRPPIGSYGKFPPVPPPDDPCDEWPVFIWKGELSTLIECERNWLFSDDGDVISWDRIGEDETGDTIYRCIIAKPLK
jgi:hypothetical protein